MCKRVAMKKMWHLAIVLVASFAGPYLSSLTADEWTTPDELKEARRQVLVSEADDPSAWMTYAETALRYQYTDEAFAAVNNILSRRPDNRRAQFLLALTQLRSIEDPNNKSQSYARGLRTLQMLPNEMQMIPEVAAVARASQHAIDAERLIERGLRSSTKQHFREAASLLEHAVVDDPNNLVYRESLVWIYAEQTHEPAPGYVHANIVAKALPGEVNLNRKVGALIVYAFLASEIGRFDEAIIVYQNLVDQDYADDLVLLSFADTLVKAGQFSRGIQLYESVNSIQNVRNDTPQRVHAALEKYLGPVSLSDVDRMKFVDAMDRGMSLLSSVGAGSSGGEFETAAQSLAEAVRIQPHNHFALKTLGWLYLEKLDRAEAACAYLDIAAILAPNDRETAMLSGMARYRSGQFQAAIATFSYLLHNNPGDAEARTNLGFALARADRANEARAAYSAVLKNPQASSTERRRARLGQTELMAWEGETELAIKACRSLLSEDPEFADAVLLLADLHRWDWDLGQAEAEYQQVLAGNSRSRPALDGLLAIQEATAWKPGFRYYSFVDNFLFERIDYTYSLRVPLSDRAYASAAFDDWRFTQNAIDLQRLDGNVDMEYHFSSSLEAVAGYRLYAYENHVPEHSVHGSGKWSPMPDIDVFLSAAGNEPAYLDSINIPLQNIRMDSFGIGLEAPVVDRISFQSQYSDSFYSDDNRRRFLSGQLSCELCEACGLIARFRTEYLTYEDQTSVYFSPTAFRVYRPMVEVLPRVCDWLLLDLKADVPYVQEETTGWGYSYLVGAILEVTEHCTIRGSYAKSSVPTALPFSGDVLLLQASLQY